jgi:hypothetical protein
VDGIEISGRDLLEKVFSGPSASTHHAQAGGGRVQTTAAGTGTMPHAT